MNTQGLLGSIFLESVGSASIVPFISSITLEAMQLFGGYTLLGLPLVAACLGNVVGCVFNWVFGLVIYLLRTRVTFLGKDPFVKSQVFFRRYGWALCALYWLPLGSIILVVSGFLRAPLPKIMLAATIGAAIHLTMVMR